MKAFSRNQFLLIAGTVFLIMGMSYIPITSSQKKGIRTPPVAAASFNLHAVEEIWRSSAPAELLPVISDLEQREKKYASDPASLAAVKESLAAAWDSAKALVLSARYYEELASLNHSEKNWLNAAYRYFDVFSTSKNQEEKEYFVNKAVICYSKVLELNPKNLDAKTDLGVCLTEKGGSPMQGITLLKEVVAVNPDHENAQFNLGILSIRSKQHQKAIDRFEKVLKINPSRIDLYIYIAEAYIESGNVEKGITYFEKYKTISKDSITIREINRYVEKLKGIKN